MMGGLLVDGGNEGEEGVVMVFPELREWKMWLDAGG
jgi:hypothetical protein